MFMFYTCSFLISINQEIAALLTSKYDINFYSLTSFVKKSTDYLVFPPYLCANSLRGYSNYALAGT